MAITMKLNYSIHEVAKQANLPQSKIAKAKALEEAGVYFGSDMQKILLIWKNLKVGHIHFKPDLLKHIIDGKLGSHSIKIFGIPFGQQVDHVYETVFDGVDNDVYPVDVPDTSPYEDDAAMLEAIDGNGLTNKDLKKYVLESLGSTVPGTTTNAKVDILPVDDKSKTVPLRDATKLYQPVMGTDESSRYFAIALGADANVAVRIKQNNRISFRIEGADLSPYFTQLQGAGFTKGNKGHWSIHMDCGDDELTKKAVGSLIFATGIEFNELAMNVLKLKGKGH